MFSYLMPLICYNWQNLIENLIITELCEIVLL